MSYLIPLAGSKINTQIDERPEGMDFEIKMKYHDRMVRKLEFLELVFDGFKECLEFSSAFRLCGNFTQFFEGGSFRPLDSRRISLKPVKGGPHLLYNDRDHDRNMTLDLKSPGIKSPFTRINNLNYKNYRTDSVKDHRQKEEPCELYQRRRSISMSTNPSTEVFFNSKCSLQLHKILYMYASFIWRTVRLGA